jgi:hypothetical protein
MIRFLLRFLGLITLAAAFVFFIYDGARYIANQRFEFTKVGDVWSAVHQSSLAQLQPAIEQHVGVWLWDPVMLSLLTRPVWLVLLIVGAILIVLGRRKKPLIGYAR